MSDVSPNFVPPPRREPPALKGEWGWFFSLGIMLVILGTLSIIMPFMAGMVVAQLIGMLLLFSGIAQIIGSIWSRRWTSFLHHLLAGVLYTVVGFLMLDKPVTGMATLTLLMAAFFLVGGLFRIIIAVSEQFPHWGWVVLSGLVSVLMGAMIWRNLPAAALWVIGLFVGIEMIFNGWAWIMLGLVVRKLTRRVV